MRPATHPTSAEARHGVGTALASKQRPRGIRGRWQTVRDCLPTSYFALHRELYGPQRPAKVSAGYIGGVLLLVLAFMIGGQL